MDFPTILKIALSRANTLLEMTSQTDTETIGAVWIEFDRTEYNTRFVEYLNKNCEDGEVFGFNFYPCIAGFEMNALYARSMATVFNEYNISCEAHAVEIEEEDNDYPLS